MLRSITATISFLFQNAELILESPETDTESEKRRIDDLLTNGCGCSLNCVTKFTFDEIALFRNECFELDVYESNFNKLDVVILGQLTALCVTDNKILHANKKSEKERQRQKIKFHLKGYQVCQKMFLFVHCISKKRLKRIMLIYKDHGLVNLVHGNVKRSPNNTCTAETTENVVKFIQNYAHQHALFLPGRVSSVVSKFEVTTFL